MNVLPLAFLRRSLAAFLALFRRPPRRQVGALVWRRGPHNGVEVLTVTTRRSGRWSTPKGWPISGLTDAEAAAQEAWEEAGVRGRADTTPLGAFTYEKRAKRNGPPRRIAVTLYAVEAASIADQFPEAGQRKRVWRDAATAAGVMSDPELGALIAAFDP